GCAPVPRSRPQVPGDRSGRHGRSPASGAIPAAARDDRGRDATVLSAAAPTTVRPRPTMRLALALPVGSTRSIIAGTQAVIYLLRHLGKTQLDLSDRAPPVPPAGTRSAVRITLFAAVVIEQSLDDETRARLEQQVRERIERYYARQGISPVYYDLQAL